MIRKYFLETKIFHFTDDDDEIDLNKNLFTIIVGKNGTGKSRLLSSIVKEFLKLSNKANFYSDSEMEFETSKTGKIEYQYEPKKIITASTSPFDRFPLIRYREEVEGYSYLGLRELTSYNFGLAYMSKIMASLIESIQSNNKQMEEITNVLNYLGYTDRIEISFHFRHHSKIFDELLDAENPTDDFEKIVFGSRQNIINFNRRFFTTKDPSLNRERIGHLIEILKHKEFSQRSRSFKIEINKNGIHSDDLFEGFVEELGFLMKSGIIRLRDVSLQRMKPKSRYSISEASSGEQSVVMSILGIASQIQNNSLICIDEPEICLHPEWQEKYIRILISTFKNYKGCHFLIATHSPQIISKLDSSNCYVLTMETGNVTNAKYLINHSADFQLANIFNSPGYKNEYLTRVALNIFAKVSKRKTFDSDDLENYNLLENLSSSLDRNDPVFGLFTAIKEMHQTYA